MRFVQHPSNNSVLGAPPGVQADVCTALPITRVVYSDGVNACLSYWQPSEDERAAIAAGKAISLSIWGTTHGPVSLGVDGLTDPLSRA